MEYTCSRYLACKGDLQATSEFQCHTAVLQTTPYSTAINTAGFDNVAQAMLSEFQCLTFTGWGYVMSRTMDNSSPLTFIFFFTLVVIGGYFVVQLFLAVLKTKFAKAQSIFHSKSAGRRHKQTTLTTLLSRIGRRVSKVS